jgi:site-specific DNA-methyltransferase (adenine-specific)
MTYTLHTGDCRDVMATLPAESVDAIVCDPPYGLSFMGKGWDHGVPGVDFWVEALRVLKPGGHLIAFGGTRTYHRLAVAIEDAGFEVRDCLMWLYGSGFPKSLDVSKAMDKQNGEQRRARFLRFTEWMRSTGITAKKINEITDSFMGSHYLTDREQPAVPTEEMFSKLRPHLPTVPDDIEELVRMRTVEAENFKARKVLSETRVDMFGEYEVEKVRTSGIANKNENKRHTIGASASVQIKETAPNTDLAKEWHGWGTALKPAYEPAILARKTLRGTVADNVAQWGVGGLNIDGCRVGDESTLRPNSNAAGVFVGKGNEGQVNGSASGRWPANVILDEEAAAALDEQSGVGGASRFFYTAKASRSEREAGLDGVEQIKADAMTGKEYREDRPTNHPMRANHHPTVKPIALMRYMIRLVAPRGAVVLDPFMGSGSTGCAAMVEGMQFVGIDITPEYVDIARQRIAWWSSSSPLDNMATMELHEENEA